MIPRAASDVLMALMEALWVFAAVAMFTAVFADGRTPGPLTLIGTAIAAIAVTRVVRAFDFSQVTLAALGGVISLVAIYAILRLEYAGDLALWDLGWLSLLVRDPGQAFSGQAALVCGAVAVLAFWLRWGLLAQDKVHPGEVRGSFGIGLIFFTLAVLLRNDMDEGHTIVVLVLPFVASGLIAMAVAQQVETGKLGGLSLTGPWGLAVLGTLAGIFVLAGLAALVPESGLSEPLVPLFEAILLAGGLTILIFALPLVLLTELFLILVPVQGIGADPFPNPGEVAGPLATDDDAGGSDYAWIFISARVLGVIFIVLLLILILGSLFLYLRRRREVEEERESVEPVGSVIDDLLSLLKSLRPLRSGRTESPLPDLDESGLAIRRLYLNAVDEAAARGAERRPSSTPRQFQPALEQAYPGSFGAEITAEFERVRYGRRRVRPQRVDELRQVWRRRPRRRT